MAKTNKISNGNNFFMFITLDYFSFHKNTNNSFPEKYKTQNTKIPFSEKSGKGTRFSQWLLLKFDKNNGALKTTENRCTFAPSKTKSLWQTDIWKADTTKFSAQKEKK
ncbi:MAG: hypothetical protein J6Y35_00790 [Bacteroidales bacterium]|nr:hypothetical protein [Bacteroidales bacterium]